MMEPSDQHPSSETAREPRAAINQRADDDRARMVPETDVGDLDPEARAPERNGGMTGTMPAETLVDTHPGDGSLPPAVPRIAREMGRGEDGAEGEPGSPAAMRPTSVQQATDRESLQEGDAPDSRFE